MSRPRFIADEDLRGSIVAAVRRREPSVEFSTAVAEGWSSLDDEALLERVWHERWLLISHDVNTMKAHAERRIAAGEGIHSLFLVPQSRPTRSVADSVQLIWAASEFEEWRDRIVFLPF